MYKAEVNKKLLTITKRLTLYIMEFIKAVKGFMIEAPEQEETYRSREACILQVQWRQRWCSPISQSCKNFLWHWC